MKKCAYCGRENTEDARACFECGTEFKTPEALKGDLNLQDPTLSLVIVGTFGNVVDATMARTRLEAAGIEACIPEEYTPQILWYAVTSPLEQVTVRVAAKDYEAAKEVLKEDA